MSIHDKNRYFNLDMEAYEEVLIRPNSFEIFMIMYVTDGLMDNMPCLVCPIFFIFEKKFGDDYKLNAFQEFGPGGWMTCTKQFRETPANWHNSIIQS